MHLETMRYALYRESIAVLLADDEASEPRVERRGMIGSRQT
jgi:hypothetical protein